MSQKVLVAGTGISALQEQYGFTDDEICQALFNFPI